MMLWLTDSDLPAGANGLAALCEKDGAKAGEDARAPLVAAPPRCDRKTWVLLPVALN